MRLHSLVHRLVGGRHDADRHERMVLVGRHADWYDRLSAFALGWLYRRAAARILASVPTGGNVLDVGTGPGRLLLELATRRPDLHLTGIDPSADMINHATRRTAAAAVAGRVDARVASAEDLPFPTDSFDAVVSTLSSHHWADPAAAVAEQSRVLRPGGTLWAFDLRGVAPAAVRAALAAQFGATAVSRTRIGRLADPVIIGYRANKPSVPGNVSNSPSSS